jgi:hypothetical protein
VAKVLPLIRAINANKLSDVIATIKNGCGVDSTSHGERPLMLAIHNGQPEIVELLLKNGADWRRRDGNTSWTPLMLATLQCHLPARRHRPGSIAKASRKIVAILKGAGASDPEADGILGRIENEDAIIRAVAARRISAEADVFDVEGVVVLYPKRLKRSSLGLFIPCIPLLQWARTNRLGRLEAALESKTRIGGINRKAR